MIILRFWGKFLCITHLYAMVLTIQLACVKYAASVHPEPGSNSLKIQFIIKTESYKYVYY